GTRAGYAFDGGRSRITVFGGANASDAALADTWVFDTASWREIVGGPAPSARVDAAMAYDAKRDRVVLFGGNSGGLADTWTFDGVRWEEQFPATHPGSFTGQPAMTYDTKL